MWVLIDEVSKFEATEFPITLPEEQRESPFNYIVTGSLGIASFIQKRHLEHFVWDLPTFTQNETGTFARKLAKPLDVNLFEAFDIPKSAGSNSDDAGDFTAVEAKLQDLFGGIPGYIAELLFGLKKGKSLSDYAYVLNDRIETIIKNVANGDANMKELSRTWITGMRSPTNNWGSLRNAGLCGRNAPPGIIFTTILQNLLLYAQYKNKATEDLSVINHFLNHFKNRIDSGTAGNLLELQTIAGLKNNGHLNCVELVYDGKSEEWMKSSPQNLPTEKDAIICTYDEKNGTISTLSNETSPSSWCIVILPPCFPLVDVLVGCKNEPHIYLIQITYAEDPFVKHVTCETLSYPASKRRVDSLVKAFGKYLNSDTQVRCFFSFPFFQFARFCILFVRQFL